ncbi:LysR substrate-binding domain-containing protein [Marinobacterium arenosum]|uniref:LysR substrate-binding domain-containing protein n=1 Tax=Marinobacterium arenosum TaxID=2862496 RepID=UPI001C97752E|nr:LysR substrate-binding domain-containing protein [Marinobacterium arenosum]MBY4678470.1 LysR family transcriptional regulator [Marinobacterium arenosum]
MRRIPPLNPLRAFEAAARHQHFAKAAEELSVSDSAISHQVRVLEEYLGVKLFQREGREMRLTDCGRSLRPTIQQAFALIANIPAQIGRPDAPRPFTLLLPSALAHRWLSGRLEQLHDACPDIELRLQLCDQPTSAALAEVDAAICLQLPEPDSVRFRSQLLYRNSVFPACRPDLVARLEPLQGPQQLLNLRLLHGDRGDAWRDWFRVNGIELAGCRETYFNQSSMALDAALAGQGVVLVDELTAGQELKKENLVRLNIKGCKERMQYYYLVSDKSRAVNESMTDVPAWLAKQLAV